MCTPSPTCPGTRWGHTCAWSRGSPTPIPIWGDHCPAGTTAQCSEATGSPGAGVSRHEKLGCVARACGAAWVSGWSWHSQAIAHHHVMGTAVTGGCRWPLVLGEVARVPQPCCMAAPASPGQSPSHVPTGPVPQAMCSTVCTEPQPRLGLGGGGTCTWSLGTPCHSQLAKALAGVSPHLSFPCPQSTFL